MSELKAIVVAPRVSDELPGVVISGDMNAGDAGGWGELNTPELTVGNKRTGELITVDASLRLGVLPAGEKEGAVLVATAGLTLLEPSTLASLMVFPTPFRSLSCCDTTDVMACSADVGALRISASPLSSCPSSGSILDLPIKSSEQPPMSCEGVSAA
jgi:hypothetical protein